MLFYAASGVARVNDKLGVASDGVVIVAGVIGSNQDAIVACEALGRQGNRAHAGKIVVAHFVERGEVGIVVIEEGAASREQFEEFERGRFAEIVHVLFISHAEYENLRSFGLFLAIV